MDLISLCYLSLAYGHKLPRAGWLQQRTFISHSSGGWTSKVKVWADPVPGKATSWFAEGCLAESSPGREQILMST